MTTTFIVIIISAIIIGVTIAFSVGCAVNNREDRQA